MNFKYDAQDKSLVIKDGMKIQSIGIMFLMSINIFNAINRLYVVNKTDFGTLEITWVIILLLSIAVLLYFFLKRSSLEKIPVGDIKSLEKKLFFGANYYYFDLLNGKKRYVQRLRKESDITEFHKAVSEAGIQFPE